MQEECGGNNDRGTKLPSPKPSKIRLKSDSCCRFGLRLPRALTLLDTLQSLPFLANAVD